MQKNIDSAIQASDTGLHNLPNNLGPVQTKERIEVLDTIRGFALLGILIANMAWYNSPSLYFEILGKNMWTGFWDTLASSFINLFVQGKFYTMFSFLFGLGFVLFFERAKTKTERPTLLFYRRLFILLLIGLIHAFFIWHGDILVTYALLGLLLPLFFNRKPKTLLIWVISLFSAFTLFMALMVGALELGKMYNEAAITESMQPFYTQMESGIESSFQAYGHGSFSEIMVQRASDALFGYTFASIFTIFPFFLLGLYAGKKAIFQNLKANRPFIKRVWIWSLVIGLTMSIVKFASQILAESELYSPYSLLHTGAGFLGDTGLCFFFVTSIILLCQNPKWKLCLNPLTCMGRMALSNYLFQSIVCTCIFYSYGLGFYGKVGPALGFVLSIIIFIIQLFISKYWLKYYQFGPMEWIWRCLTYGKLFGMKLPKTDKKHY